MALACRSYKKEVLAMIKLGVFFTKNVGLEIWQRDGILSREVAFYNALEDRGVDVSFFTYDQKRFSIESPMLANIKCERIQQNIFNRNFVFNFLDKSRLKSSLAELDIIRSNQFYGAKEALSAARNFKKPLIVRGGYVYSRFALWQGKSQGVLKSLEAEERESMDYASAVIVTTSSMKDYIVRKYNLDRDKVYVIGNAIPDIFFKAAEVERRPKRLCDILAVGRHHPQKGYDLLLDTVRDVPDSRLTILGSGPDYANNIKFAKRYNMRFEFKERIDNHLLPNYLSSTDIYLMTSHYEGHPKSLLEAMAAGCACIVTEGQGVSDEIKNRKTGIVVPRDKDALLNAIDELRNDPELCRELGINASNYIQERYSLKESISLELAVYEDIVKKH